MSTANEAPWLAAWRIWMGLAGTAFKSPTGVDAAAPRAMANAGFAQSYMDFARIVQQILKHGGGGNFAQRLIGALQGLMSKSGGSAAGTNALNAFLRAAPSAALASLPDANAGQAWQQWTNTVQNWSAEWLALPSLGPQREWQEMLKDLQRAAQAEQVARGRIDEHYRLATRTALARFGHFLHDDSGTPITTVRALYDAWIDHAEAAYAERVMGEEFSKEFGAWVNAGSGVRLVVRALGSRVGALFDLPGREEIDALIARQQTLQRELAALRAAPAAPFTGTPMNSPPATSATRQAVNASRPRVKTATKKIAKAPRAATSAARKRTTLGDEFDIAHFLDEGK